MRPTFTTEIGRMRAEEMRQRAERYRKAASAASAAKANQVEDDSPVVTERRRSFSLRRIFAVATGAFGLLVMLATTALAMPLGPGSGGSDTVPVAPPPSESLPVFEVAPFLAALAVGAAMVFAIAWVVGRRSSPRVA